MQEVNYPTINCPLPAIARAQSQPANAPEVKRDQAFQVLANQHSDALFHPTGEGSLGANAEALPPTGQIASLSETEQS
jgi:hypothetical protein